MRNPPNSSSVFRSCSFDDFFIHFLDFSNEFVPFCLRPGWHLKCKWLIRIIIIVIHPFRDNQICWLAIKGRGGAASGRKAKMKKGLRLLLYAVNTLDLSSFASTLSLAHFLLLLLRSFCDSATPFAAPADRQSLIRCRLFD